MATAARTGAACRIAGLDRQKFNDLMASGDYPCAPKTTAGVARVFEIIDLIALTLFVQLTREGRTSAQAGETSCRVHGVLRGDLNAEHVVIGHNVNGGSFAAPLEQVDIDAKQVGGRAVLYVEIWNIANLRALVIEGLDEETRIAGED